jgi:hypothetical protein
LISPKLFPKILVVNGSWDVAALLIGQTVDVFASAIASPAHVGKGFEDLFESESNWKNDTTFIVKYIVQETKFQNIETTAFLSRSPPLRRWGRRRVIFWGRWWHCLVRLVVPAGAV